MPGRRSPRPGNEKWSQPGANRHDLWISPELEKKVFEQLEKEGEAGPAAFESLVSRAVDVYLSSRGGEEKRMLRGGREIGPGTDPAVKKASGPRQSPPSSFGRSTDRRDLLAWSSIPGLKIMTDSPADLSEQFEPKAHVASTPNQPATDERPANEADHPRVDLLRLDEITHPGARRVFASQIDRFNQLNEELREISESRHFNQSAYDEVKELLLDQGRILLPEPPVELEDRPGEELDAPHDEPLFGLHNRDYPSLWGLMLLAEAVQGEGAVAWSEFASGLQLAADAFGGCLLLLDRIERPKRGLKYSASFPDPAKRTKGGQWIQGANGRKTARLYPFAKNTFARIQKGGRGLRREARGPLPRWDAIRFISRDGELLVEPTRAGYDLLKAIDGVSLRLPHSPESAEKFLRYLMTNSPGDSNGFLHVLRAIEETGDREDVIQANLAYFNDFLGREDPNEAKTFASTMTQGYVARAREWGLLETDLVDSPGKGGKVYSLTEIGLDMVGLLSGINSTSANKR